MLDAQPTGQYADIVSCVYILVTYHAVYMVYMVLVMLVGSSLFSNLHRKNAKTVQ